MFFACAAVLTSGTITPCAPPSRTREIQSAPTRLSSFDNDWDGEVQFAEIPITAFVTLRRGEFPSLVVLPVFFNEFSPPPALVILRKEDWFAHMDRNRDGDLSRREFLGSRATFDGLDRDRDGLLSRAEATAGRRTPSR